MRSLSVCLLAASLSVSCATDGGHDHHEHPWPQEQTDQGPIRDTSDQPRVKLDAGSPLEPPLQPTAPVAYDAATRPVPWQSDAGVGEPVPGDAAAPQAPAVRDCVQFLFGDGHDCVDGDTLDQLARQACPAGKGELVSLLLQGGECAGGASSAQATCCISNTQAPPELAYPPVD